MWCWWCCHPFEGDTLELPYKYDEKRNKFYTCGGFCSWSCMKRYAIDKYGITRGGIICSNKSSCARSYTTNSVPSG